MRVRDTYRALDELRPGLVLQTDPYTSGSHGPGVLLHNKSRLAGALTALAAFPAFAAAAQGLRSHPVFFEVGEDGFMPAPDAVAFGKGLEHLARRVDDLVGVLAMTLLENDAPQIAVRLPPVHGLDDFSDRLSRLAIALDQPARRVLGGDAGVRVAGVDRGSVWIELLCNPNVLAFLTKIFDAVVSVRRRRVALEHEKAQIRLLEAQAVKAAAETKAAEAQADMFDAFASLADQITDRLVAVRARDVVTEAANEGPVRARVMEDDRLMPEPVAFVEQSIRELDKLLAAGGDIKLLEAANPREPEKSYSLLEAVNAPETEPPQLPAPSAPPKKPEEPKS